jgi:hypothetical protein
MRFVLADAAGIIGAGAGVVAVVLAVITLVVRFRPRFDVTIDERRQAIRVTVSNSGRLEGRINEVSVLDADDHEVPVEFAGLPKGEFHSGQMSHKVARSLVINATKPKPFAEDVRVFVKWGRRRKKEIVPTRKDISYFGETSDWPPPG